MLPKEVTEVDLNLTEEQQKFLARIIEISGQNVNQCFQCRKCTAGCPVASTGAMDISPTQVIHAIRLGQVDLVLNSHTIWVCASCETCTTRCPQGVDIAKVIDAARNYAKILNRVPEKSVDIFFTTFMDNIAKYGGLYELGLALGIKLKTKEFFKDAEIGRKMFFKGKLKLIHHKTKNVKEIREMLKKIKEHESK
jgi:heterodisulfide reductase subunit C